MGKSPLACFALLLIAGACSTSPEPPHCDGTQITECALPAESENMTCTDRVLQDCADRDAVCEETVRGPECVVLQAAPLHSR
jgi:hypothetical protein